MLAAVACGEYGSVEEAAGKLVKVTGRVLPDPEITGTGTGCPAGRKTGVDKL